MVELRSLAGVRHVPFGEFMTGPKRTVRGPGELITAVFVPVAAGFQGYTKVGVRNAMVIATASVALVVQHRSVAIALGSVGPTILRCPEAEALAESSADFDALRLPADVLAECCELVRRAARPIDDHRSTADYRRHAVGVLAGRLLRRAFPHE
jgi:CO/xanthine dehydrogenase FAD-binding subunit